MKSLDVIHRQIDALNRHDVAALGACYTGDAQVFDPQYPELLRGRAAIEKDFREFFGAFPDLKLQLKQAIADGGDTYAFEITMTGTHEGPLVGPVGHVPATHKRIEVGGAIIATIRDGQVVEEKRYYDLASLLNQLGLMQ
jgi:steroid delta-isomerase-like uncharacterized protein